MHKGLKNYINNEVKEYFAIRDELIRPNKINFLDKQEIEVSNKDIVFVIKNGYVHNVKLRGVIISGQKQTNKNHMDIS